MNSKICLLSLLVASLVLSATSANLPSSFNLCKRNPNFNKCLQNAIQSALVELSHEGIPELGIPTLDPVEIPRIILGGHGAVDIVQNYSNCKLYGLTKTKVTNVSADIDNYKLYIETISPFVTLTADYLFNGRLLVLPFQGEGKCNLTLFNVKQKHSLTGQKMVKSGKTYMQIKDHDIKMDPENASFRFDNLFNGNKVLADNMNAILDENWKAVFDDVKSQYEETYGIVFKDIANKIFTKVPLAAIFEN